MAGDKEEKRRVSAILGCLAGTSKFSQGMKVFRDSFCLKAKNVKCGIRR